MLPEATTPAAGEAVTPAKETSVPLTDKPYDPATGAPSKTPEAATAEPQDKTAPADDGEPTAENEGTETAKRNRVSARERIQQAVSRQRAAEAEVDRLRARLGRYEKAEMPANIDQLSYDERDKIQRKVVDRELRAEEVKGDIEDAAAEIADARAEVFLAKCEAAADRIPDIDKVLDAFGKLPCSQMLASYLANSEKAPDIVYYLTKNPGEARTLARLTSEHASPAAMARGVEIIAGITASIESRPARQTTKAPAPGTQLKGGSSPESQTAYQLSAAGNTAGYIAKRREEIAARSRR